MHRIDVELQQEFIAIREEREMLTTHMGLLQTGLRVESEFVVDAETHSSRGDADSVAPSRASTELPASLVASDTASALQAKSLRGTPERWCEIVQLPELQCSKHVVLQCLHLSVRFPGQLLVFVGERDPRRRGALPLVVVKQKGELCLLPCPWKGYQIGSIESLVEVSRAWSQGCMVVSPNSGRIVGVGLQLAVIPQIPPRLGGNKPDLALQVARDTLCLAIVRAKNGTLSIFSQCASHVINPRVDGCGDRGSCRISAI